MEVWSIALFPLCIFWLTSLVYISWCFNMMKLVSWNHLFITLLVFSHSIFMYNDAWLIAYRKPKIRIYPTHKRWPNIFVYIASLFVAYGKNITNNLDKRCYHFTTCIKFPRISFALKVLASNKEKKGLGASI